MICIRCKQMLYIECDTKTCKTCLKYIDSSLVCERCNRTYTRTDRERHYICHECRVSIQRTVKTNQFNLY